MGRKCLALLVMLLWFWGLPLEAWGEAPAVAQTIPDTLEGQVEAKAAVVIDGETGRVLFAKNANQRLPMASTTKIMTALLTLEQPNLEEYFVVDSQAIRVEGSSMGLKEGDQASLKALAYGMLLASGNDGANAAAVQISGSIAGFVERMNQRAQEMGLEDTHFVTPSGLGDPEHYSSAYDMALLAKEALKNPLFAEICGQKKGVVSYGNPPYNRWLTNHNRLLSDYPGTIGVKTGFTKEAGRCLVSCAQRDGVRLIVVTLGCPDDWTVHRTLYDRYFARLSLREVPETQVSVPVTGGSVQKVAGVYDPISPVALAEGERLQVKVLAQPFVYAPVEQGQALGELRVYCDGQLLAQRTLTAADYIPAKEREGLFQKLLGSG